ncbi:MAG: hypothetical protein ABIR79_22665 [Candidatus Binatia bacterium]
MRPTIKRSLLVLMGVVAVLPALPATAQAQAARCQREIVRQAAKFTQAKADALRACEDVRLKTGSADPCPETKASAKIQKAELRMRAKIAQRCGGGDGICGTGDDPALAAIGWNIGTCPGLDGATCTQPIGNCRDIGDCLACVGHAAVDRAIDLYYDDLHATGNAAILACQRAIGRATTKFFRAKSKALAGCSDRLVQGKVGACPDARTTAKIAKAEAKKVAKICRTCGGPDAACGGPDDLDLAAIGAPPTCPNVIVPGGTRCARALDALPDLVACVDCVTEFEADCVDAASRGSLTAYPPECPGHVIPSCAQAKIVSNPIDLIGGTLARGRTGDVLLENDKIRTIVQQPGRIFFGIGTYGGNIIDADVQRVGEPGRDNFEELIPGINIENTARYGTMTILNDGSNCAPAVVRFTGVDELFDFVNGSSAIRDMGFTFPTGADDRDLHVTVQTDYTLATGNAYVRIDTTITNLDPTPLSIYFAEYINGSGEVEMWRPAYGFGEPLATTSCPPATYLPCSAGTCDPCNFIAFSGENGGAGVSYGYIHTANGTTAVTVSGVTVPVLGQEAAAVFLGADAPNFAMGPAGVGDAVTIARYFAVGDGSVGSIADVRNQLQGFVTGTLQGTVTSGGQPVVDADVAVLGTAYPSGPASNIVDHFRTAADGTYAGTVPAGAYTVRVNKDGRLFGSPDPASVTVAAALSTTQNFTLPAPGRLQVTLTDENGAPLPAKLQLVGFDPSPEPINNQNVLGAIVNNTATFGEAFEDGLAFGIAFVSFVDRTGDSGVLEVEPGTYQLVLSRGPRYSAFTQPVTITAGVTTSVTAQIARVVDTPGFVSSDFHVHSINSPDCEVTNAERVATEIAEGMDFFTPSDHDFRTDFLPTIAALGVGDLIATAPSGEITTFDYGHFNAWPVAIDPSQLQGGVIDWGGAVATPGTDFPSFGNYAVPPAQIYALAHADTPGNVIQINHMESHFGRVGLDIDTAEGGTGPAQSHIAPLVRRLNPALPNLFDSGFDALEVWIGTNNAGGITTLVGENMGDWFNLINQGIVRTGVTDSDTHQQRSTQINARSYVASAVTIPGALGAQALALAANVKAGRVIGTNGPFVAISATSGAASAGLGVGQPTLLTPTTGNAVTVTVTATSPLWAEFDRIELYVTNAPQPYDHDGDAGTRDRYRVIPNLVHTAGPDFTVTTVNDFPSIPGASHLEATTTFNLTGVASDAWVLAVVRGSDGVSHPTFPVLPNSLAAGSNATLADLTDGNLGEGGILAFAYTNPLFIDGDNDSAWTPPGVVLTPP